MKTPLHKRELPYGFTLGERTSESWRVGHVFRWSEVFGRYVAMGRISVKPGECIADAFAREYEEPMGLENDVFFCEDF